MIAVVIVLLVGLLIWITLEWTYIGPTQRNTRFVRFQNYAVLVLVVIFGILVIWQIYLILKPVLG